MTATITTPCPTCDGAISAGAECAQCAKVRQHQNELLLATSGTKGGIISGESLFKSGTSQRTGSNQLKLADNAGKAHSGGFAADDELAKGGGKGGLVGNDPQLT